MRQSKQDETEAENWNPIIVKCLKSVYKKHFESLREKFFGKISKNFEKCNQKYWVMLEKVFLLKIDQREKERKGNYIFKLKKFYSPKVLVILKII